MKLGTFFGLVALWALIVSHDLVLGLIFLGASVFIFMDILFDHLGGPEEDDYDADFDKTFNQASFGPEFPVGVDHGHIHFLQKENNEVQVFMYNASGLDNPWKRVDDTPYKEPATIIGLDGVVRPNPAAGAPNVPGYHPKG